MTHNSRICKLKVHIPIPKCRLYEPLFNNTVFHQIFKKATYISCTPSDFKFDDKFQYRVWNGADLLKSDKYLIICYSPNEIYIYECKGLEELERDLSKKLLDVVVDELGATKGLLSYRSSDSGKLYYDIKEVNDQRILLVISADETQPALYKVALEGIWKLKSIKDEGSD